MNTDSSEYTEFLLVKAVQLLLDDPNGISDAAYEYLMNFIYNAYPKSKALEYLAATQSFKGRKFLDEDFELSE
jgi:hypothetical protein